MFLNITFQIRNHFSLFIILALGLLLVACDSSQPQKSENNIPIADNSFENYVELGDLPELREHGKLRILLGDASREIPYFPRQGLPVHYESDLLTRFANQMGLEPEWIYVDSFDQLIPMLLAGKGDIIAANMTITGKRKNLVAFSVPVAIATEQLVTRKDDDIKTISDLQGRDIAVLKSTSFWDTVSRLKEKYPRIGIQEVPASRAVLEILDGVANHEYDATIVDSNVISAILPIQPNLKVAFNVSKERPMAWAIRKNATSLQQELNNFLNREHLTPKAQQSYKADLDAIKKRKVLRVLTRNNAATYFLWRGELMGFEYEFARHFAQSIGVRLEMVVPPSREALMQWLVQGKGDMIAASITIPDRNTSSTIMYSQPYNKVSEIVVGRSNESEISDIKKLSGRTFYVRRSSSYWGVLQKIKKEGVDIIIKAAPEIEETEEIIAKVAEGEYDLTLSDSHILDIELTWRDDIKGILNIGSEVSHGWVVRKDSPALLQAINQYITKEYRGLFYNITHRKYFEKSKTIAKRLEQRVDGNGNGKLSPYDNFAKEFARQFNFDWRLIVAQMYQESRFDPQAKSWAGARGLMQVMPRTARELGIKNISDPELSLKAGVKYLDWLRDRFEPELPVKDRMWFALAAYNAGAGHVHDARNLARKMGWESTRWFDNVERAMLLLSKRKYARQAKHGYVRGLEPVKYVREIRSRFNAYVKLTEGLDN